MALNALGLGLIFSAKDATQGVIKRIGDDFIGLEGKTSKAAATFKGAMASMAGGLGLLVAGTVGVVGAFKAAEAAGKFGMGLAGVGAVSRATAKEMAQLEEAAIKAGIATQFSPTEAVEGLRNLAVQGFTAAEATEALGPALDLAAGGQISVAQASMTTASALRAFGLQTDQAAITTDKLLRISNATALQANDLQLALGTVARGAGLAKQSIDEMLPSVGLVKNTGVDASVAASSVSSALIFMAKQGKKFKKLGIDVTDAKGNFRPFLDIVLETQKTLSTKFPDAAERAAKATKLFGRFGVAAFQAISNQAETGIRSTTGEILKGAKAIEFLRNQMKSAAGAAEEFREKLLDTFEGQKVLLKGSLQTFAVVFGKPFAKALKPVVTLIVLALNVLIKIVRAIPGPIKTFVATLVTAASAAIALTGAIILFKGALIVIKAGLVLFGAAMAPFLILAVKVIAVVAILTAAAFVLKKAWNANLFGISDAVRTVFSRIMLVFKAFAQLVKDGGFSGEVLKELSIADQGIKNFVISAFIVFSRLRSFFEGMAGAFNEALGPGLKEIGAAFGELFEAIGELLSAFGFVDVKVLGTGEQFQSWGAVVGSIFGAAARIVAFFVSNFVRGITLVVNIVRTVIQFFNFLKEAVESVFTSIGSKIDAIAGRVSGVATKIAGAASLLGFDLGISGGATPALAAGGAAGGAVPAAAAAGGARPAVAAAAATKDQGSIFSSIVDSIASAVSSQPIVLRNVTTLDGQTIADNQETVQRQRAATSFGNVRQED